VGYIVPNNKNWNKSINKQMAKKATGIMLSERLRKEELSFVSMPKAEVRKILNKQIGKKALVISASEEIKRNFGNVEIVKVVDPMKLNAKHLVEFKNILVDQDVIKILEERLTNGK
jgi:ribosomal protein L4